MKTVGFIQIHIWGLLNEISLRMTSGAETCRRLSSFFVIKMFTLAVFKANKSFFMFNDKSISNYEILSSPHLPVWPQMNFLLDWETT